MAASQPLTAFLVQSDEFRKVSDTIYAPLDTRISQIRLVHIQPSAIESEDIHLRLEVVNLDDFPKFQAISYTWGSRSPTAQVYLHGHVYNVTQNQFEALRRFRQVDSVRIMWMDVICINEDDVIERSSQVSMMSRIYSISQQTQIWLGETNAECTRGFTEDEWLATQTWFWDRRRRPQMTTMVTYACENEEFSHRAELASAFEAAVKQPGGIINGAIHILKLLGTDLHYWELPSFVLDSTGEAQMYRPWFESMQTLKAILQNPYWKRVWTVQEALLSPIDAKVHIGKFEAPFSHFLALGKSVFMHVGNSVACCPEMDDMIMYQDDDLPSDLFLVHTSRCITLFTFFRDLESGKLAFDLALQLSNKMEAFDARDYVYGVLGFVSEDLKDIVDYSMSTSEVFQRATFLCWKSRGSLGWLKNGRLDCGGCVSGLPSWCMDLTNSEIPSFKFYESFFEGEVPDWDRFKVDFSIGRLVLEGYSIGAVKLRFERSDPPSSRPTDANLRIVTDWASQIKKAQLESDTELDPQKNRVFFRRFFDTIFRDTVFDMQDGEARIRRLTEADWEEIEYWWEVASQGSSVTEWDQDRQNAAWQRISRTALAFYLGLADSTLAITSNNQLSLAPLTVNPGDQLFHIIGCCMPLVLREVVTEQDSVAAGLAMMSLGADTNKPDRPVLRTFQIVGPCYVKGLMGSYSSQDLQPETIALI